MKKPKRSEIKEKQDSQKQIDDTTKKIRSELESRFGGEIASKVITELDDPDSEMSQILTDEKGKTIAEAVFSSDRRADLLALMQAKPEIFRAMMDLPQKKQEFRVYQLEDQIEARYAQLEVDEKAKKEKKERAENTSSRKSS